ncbi:MAG: HEAT repeat domain-containing protein [Planctomycetota bacterium]|jgi:HEAT repeat protein
MKVWRLPVLLCATLCLAGSSIRPDLDVGVPPGSPITWGQQFPALIPRDKPLIPLPATKSAGRKGRTQRSPHTVVSQRTTEAKVRMSSSFGVLRILTWDIGGHLRWVSQPLPDEPAKTGTSKLEPQLPEPDEALYWACISPLLRLMLHPQQVSRSEVIAHLVEIGEPVAAVLDNAVSEPSLQSACDKIRVMIASGRRGPSPSAGKTPRETMLKRFVADELIREFPYDPEGGFGRRLFLFGEEIVPFLIEYAGHKDSFLRRNAISALGRHRTTASLRALNEVATNTKDPVALMRSLAALGAHRSLAGTESLLRRLAKHADAIEDVAIVVALGRCYRRDAVPTLRKLAADRRLFDRQLAALTALARIRFEPEGDAVYRLAKRLSRLANKSPGAFADDTPASKVQPDIPDLPDMRGRVVEQMALLLRVRLNPKDEAAKKMLLALGSKKARPRVPGKGRRPAPRRGPFSNAYLGEVMPAVQMLYLETLRELGRKGIAKLEAIAATQTVEPMLRGHALLYLAPDTREKIALRILDERSESAEMQTHALEALFQAGSSKVLEVCEDLLEKCGRQGRPELASPQHRYLWLQALRILDHRDALDLEKLRPLLKYVAAAKEVDRTAILARVKALVQKLVDGAVARKKRKGRDKLMQQLIDLVIEYELRPYINEKTRASVVTYLERQLEAIRSRRKDPRYKELITKNILSYLTGGERPRFSYGNVKLKPVVLLEEEILFAIGRLETKEAADTLVEIIADPPSASLRAHACLALGLTGEQSVATRLVPSLVHQDGFVRFCAYEALHALTGQEFWADWMYGDRKQWVAAAEEYMRWLGRRR